MANWPDFRSLNTNPLPNLALMFQEECFLPHVLPYTVLILCTELRFYVLVPAAALLKRSEFVLSGGRIF